MITTNVDYCNNKTNIPISSTTTSTTATKNEYPPNFQQRRGSLAQMMSMTATSSLQQNSNTLFNTTTTTTNKTNTPLSSSFSNSNEGTTLNDPVDPDSVMDFLSPQTSSTRAISRPGIPNRRRSSSCTMLTSIHKSSINTNVGFEVHTLYKIKRSRSARKLNNFFGEQTPDDICIAEIRGEGLKALLQSKIPLCYFLYHLLQEINSENLFFFTEIEQYESFTYLTSVQQLATAQHIYDTYLNPNSLFEVNIDEQIRHAVAQSLCDKERISNCFYPAKAAVYALLESSFMRFIDSPIWQEMVEQCGGENNAFFYDNKTREAAVNTLLRFIEQQHAMLYTNPHMDAPLSLCMKTAKKRHELAKSMVHEFCKTVIGVEFTYYNIWDQDADHYHMEDHSIQDTCKGYIDNVDNNDSVQEHIRYMSPSQYNSTFSFSSMGSNNAMSRPPSNSQISLSAGRNSNASPSSSPSSSSSSSSRSGSHLIQQALKRPRQIVEAFELFARKKK